MEPMNVFFCRKSTNRNQQRPALALVGSCSSRAQTAAKNDQELKAGLYHRLGFARRVDQKNSGVQRRKAADSKYIMLRDGIETTAELFLVPPRVEQALGRRNRLSA